MSNCRQTSLFEVAVILRNQNVNTVIPDELIVPPTPTLQSTEKACEYHGLFLAKEKNPDLDVSKVEVLIRPFS